MNEPLPSRPDAVATVEPSFVGAAERVTLDGRNPVFLDRRGRAMQVVSGHVDVSAVGVSGEKPETARHHLFRIERGEIFADMFDVADASEVRMMAVGDADTEALGMRGVNCSDEALQAWLAKLPTLIAGPSPSWDQQEGESSLAVEMKPGDRRRGPARKIVWMSAPAGHARLMGPAPACQPRT